MDSRLKWLAITSAKCGQNTVRSNTTQFSSTVYVLSKDNCTKCQRNFKQRDRFDRIRRGEEPKPSDWPAELKTFPEMPKWTTTVVKPRPFTEQQRKSGCRFCFTCDKILRPSRFTNRQLRKRFPTCRKCWDPNGVAVYVKKINW